MELLVSVSGIISEIDFDRYSSEYNQYYNKFHDKTIFNSPNFLSLYLNKGTKFIFLKYKETDVDLGYCIFTLSNDQNKLSKIYTSHGHAPYSSIITTSNEVEFNVRFYNSIISHIFETNKLNSVDIEFRVPPGEFFPNAVNSDWILWSIGGKRNSGYFGRFFENKTSICLNRNRLRNTIRKNSLNYEIREIFDLSTNFYNLIVDNRRIRHDANLTHSYSDLKYFLDNSPELIKLYELKHHNLLCCALVIFQDYNQIIMQYLAGSACSYTNGCQDVFLKFYLDEYYTGEKPLLFGTSTEPSQDHKVLNIGLDRYKSSWGASVYTCFRFLITK